MKFPYKKLATGITRPIIPIEIKYNNNSIRYEALIDSGADICIFHPEIAEILKIDIEKGIRGKVNGIVEGEPQYYYIHLVELVIGGWSYETKVAFMPNLSKNGYGLLGQYGFFDLFKSIKFEFGKDIEINNK